MTPDLIAGRYRVIRAVGRGGMGTVWLCRDEVLGREVAVKQVGQLPGESASETARALREARSSAALNHKNVVSVFDVVDSGDGRAWLVMEYVPSRTLSQILGEDGPLSPQRAAGIGAQVADGLTAAHALGIMHRDVKPGNILVGDHDVAKISDFGIARMTGEDQLTRTGLVTGTPSYFSPELARGAEPGPESDVYALGATLYAAVQGRPPYPEQRNAIAMLQQIASAPPPKPDRAGPLAGPIDRMMDRDPRSRWTMADAAHALHRVVKRPHDDDTAVLPSPLLEASRREDASVTSDAAAAPGSGPGENQRRRGVVPWLVAAVAALLLLGLGYAALQGTDPASPPQAGKTSPTPAQEPEPKPEPEPEAEREPEPEPEPEPEDQGDQAEDVGRAQEKFVEEYFSFMPDDTDAGWERLASSMKDQGRDTYEAWWDSVDSVELERTEAVEGQQAVEVELTYVFTDGSTTEETQLIILERSEGRYLIADDEVLSSRTVS